jgi:hypothetical protein
VRPAAEMSRIIYFATFLKDLSEGRLQRDARHRREYQSTAAIDENLRTTTTRRQSHSWPPTSPIR